MNSLNWNSIQYESEVPKTFLIPEHHWPQLLNTSLSLEQRIRLNHLASYFMCEMFVYFETSIIQYMEYNKSKIFQFLTEKQYTKFIYEEKEHIRAFKTLSKIIAPELYSEDKLQFLHRSSFDSLILRHTPLSSFFMMAFLFEEMTLFVFPVMQEKLDESWKPVLDVMDLHAREEKSHVRYDRIVVEGVITKRSFLRTQFEMLSLLPLVAYSDKKVALAWKKAAKYFAIKENLNATQYKEIKKKGMSKSDRMGISSYIQKNEQKPVPGLSSLSYALSKLI
ncbi:MAG: diiron oxygenase [Leptospiraceae bacterium]|nr:diiron oxygenase [Leptospiraceae bacterium]MCP5499202.1 diiron oxygenase [Leptospiraceae bacterium]